MEKAKRNVILAITHGGSSHVDDLLSISILSYFTIYNYSIPLYVIRNSEIEKILKLSNRIKNNYEISSIYILDQTLNINELKEEFKNIQIETIDHHNISTNNCTFQLLLEYLYPEYSLKLLDYDFDIDIININFNNLEINETFKPINYIKNYLELLSINDTNGPIESFKYFYNRNIRNIDELLKFEYFLLKNPLNYSIIRFFSKKYSNFSNSSIFLILRL